MRKLFQMKMYSFLSSRWGMTFCVVGLFVTLNTIFQLVQLLITTESVVLVSHEYTQNVGGNSYKHIMCADPIDIVYTWVNGTDPKHKKAVAEYKKLVRDPNMKVCNSTQVPDKDNCYKDEDTASRFVDNEELRYSLRSIEAFAPWVRHIYLVTNGQVPSWINTEHPRLSVITHSQIFTNKSHLPTFSSPSIEVHLHRIPGLSKKFIYLNDDVMFGRDVYPDDFYTLNAGQKVFLSWAVPNCAEGCPPNWVGDGYCDLACNVSACDFDAGDCSNYTAPATYSSRTGLGGNTIDNSQRYKNYCSKGCPDSWIGDKYCDRMCKNLECAFDAGDCGVEDIFGSMFGVHVTNDTTTVPLASGLSSVYFNLSDIVGSATITDGSHDNVELVRTATISQKFKIMTLTFHRNISYQEVMLSVTAENTTESGNKTTIEKTFNITLDTIVHPSNETETAQGEFPMSNIASTTLSSPDIDNVFQVDPQAPTSSTQTSATVIALEPAQQLPREVAIETQIENGSGGLINQAPTQLSTALDGSAPESIVPMESVPQQTNADPVGSANTGQQTSENQAQAPQTQAPETRSFETKASEAEAPDTKASETQNQKEQPHGIQEDGESELTLKGRPEARQSDNYNDIKQNRNDHVEEQSKDQSEADDKAKAEVNGNDQSQAEAQRKDQQKTEAQSDDNAGHHTAHTNENTNQQHDKEPNAQQPLKPDQAQDGTFSIEDRIAKQKEPEMEHLGDLFKQTGNQAVEDVEIQHQDGQNPVNGGNGPNLEQKFVLADPDAGDSSGALNAGDKEETDHANSRKDVHVEDTKQDTKQDTIENKDTDKTADGDDKLPLNVPEAAKNERPPNARNILSIEVQLDDEVQQSVVAPKYPTPKYPEDAEEHKRWWDMMTEQKKQDLQQLEESKKQLEEIESKIRQNRELELQLAAEEAEDFPWDIEKRFALYESNGGGRKLLDDFADSLKHVNKLYTKAFGASARKVPAHMPHMIDKDIMEELQSKWPQEWNDTSSHRLRSGKDMQFAFAYFYYLIHARVEYNLTNVWETELDMDKDGVLNDNELRTLGVHLYGAPLKHQQFAELKERLVNACLILHEQDPTQEPLSADELEGSDSNNVVRCNITIDVVDKDNRTAEDIKKIFSKKAKYRHQIEGTDEVAFLMIGNNETVVQGKLDGIRTKRQKFICLNDNMNHSNPETDAVVKVLHDLYTAIVPKPSSFELPPNVRNAYLYIDEINAAKAAAKRARQYEMGVGILAIGVILLLLHRCRKYASTADRRVRERRAKRLLNSGGIS